MYGAIGRLLYGLSAPNGGVSARAEYSAVNNDSLLPMGITSENVAEEFGITRERQDRMAYLSNINAAKAWDSAAPLGAAMKKFLLHPPPSLIADATPEQEMRKALEYEPPPAVLDFNAHLFGPKAGMPRLPPPPKGGPRALMPPSGLDVATAKPKSRAGPHFPGTTAKRGPT